MGHYPYCLAVMKIMRLNYISQCVQSFNTCNNILIAFFVLNQCRDVFVFVFNITLRVLVVILVDFLTSRIRLQMLDFSCTY